MGRDEREVIAKRKWTRYIPREESELPFLADKHTRSGKSGCGEAIRGAERNAPAEASVEVESE
jgi:hypothetical protein